MPLLYEIFCFFFGIKPTKLPIMLYQGSEYYAMILVCENICNIIIDIKIHINKFVNRLNTTC